MENIITQEQRYVGALLGLAVADAVGTTNEFKTRKTAKPITDMVGGGQFHLKPGEWTDDTSLALCLAASLIANNKYDAQDVLRRFGDWMHNGYMSSNGACFDIGGTTARGIDAFLAHGTTEAGPNGAPANGSIMRLAPVPMFFATDLRLAQVMSAQSSLTTHGNYACQLGCAFLGNIIARLLNGDGDDKQKFLTGLRHDTSWAVSIPGNLSDDNMRYVANVLRVANGSYLTLTEDKVSQNGSVWETLEAALFTFANTSNFRDGALMIAARGDDSDTVGAVFGQIAGAFYGVNGIPAEWVERCVGSDMIQDMAKALYALSHGKEVNLVSLQEHL